MPVIYVVVRLRDGHPEVSRQAADLDYRLVVLGDGCLDADAEGHRVLTEKVFPRQADVMTIDTWIGQRA